MKPRILLVEDDPVSRNYLATAVEALPAVVDAVETCAQAIESATLHTHALWLIDANLPDGTGSGLLARLQGLTLPTPALAHTASDHQGEHEALLAAGFVDVLVKPIAMLELQSAICRVLGFDLAVSEGESRICAKLPDWDDAAALAALKGEPTHVTALRRLFLDELPQQRRAVLTALRGGNAIDAGKTLHMLRASCGFVGATRLADAVRALESEPQSEFAIDRFDTAASDLLVRPEG